MLDEATCAKLARTLDDARRARREIEPLHKTFGEFTLEDGYRIQRAGIGLRVDRGEAISGYKMGLTSKAKREQMNLAMPIYGILTDAMRIPDGQAFHVARGIHPRVEPEIAFVTSRELREPIDLEEAPSAIAAVCAALDVLDSRYTGFKYFSLPDVVADNASSSHFVLSEDARAPSVLNFADLDMRVIIDGKAVHEAKSNAISVNPLLSLVQIVELLHAHGQELPSSSLVLTGAATPAEPIHAGQTIRLEVKGLAPV